MRVECGELRVERKNEEHKIMNEIRLGVADECVTFRANVGKGYTKDGRYFDTGLPVGFILSPIKIGFLSITTA